MAASRTVYHTLQRRLMSSAASSSLSSVDAHSHRSSLFSSEQSRQRALIPRVEKIEVKLQVPGFMGTVLLMNKGLSTPFSCSRHLTEWHVKSSALALVDGQPWHMNRPLTQSCDLTFLTFKDEDPEILNQAYWRSCASLLAQVVKGAFKEKFSVELLKIPEVPVTAGAFCCDFLLDPQLDAWIPSEENLRSFTINAVQLISKDLPWEPLDVSFSLASEIFKDSRSKLEEVEEQAAQNPGGTVTIYRCGDHVTLSSAPMVSRTGLCSQFEVTSMHTLPDRRRIQGLSLPVNLTAHHTVWRRLQKRAKKLVELPSSNIATLPGAETVFLYGNIE